MNRKTILVVDDSLVNQKILEKLLSENYNILFAENGMEALSVLRNNFPQISGVMLDLVMPVMNGYEFLKNIKNEEFCNVPVIVTTGNDGYENEIKALELGAWDFITKPYNYKIINFRLKNAIERSQLFAFEQIKYLAEFDSLTGIYNKGRFFSETKKMLEFYKDKSFVFLRFDIDRFKLINSFYGTDEGDKLLKYVADGIKKTARQSECYSYGRIESDIFAICFIYNKNTIDDLFKYVREYLSAYNPNYTIVPSMGVYIVEDKSMPIESMYDFATLASRKCKGSYIHIYSYYNEKMGEELQAEQEITNEMNYALENNQFVIYYQPKYDTQTNMPAGGEALVRWNHPKKGMISPGVFIPVFERNGFISKLDYYVWESVTKQLKKWIDDGKTPFPVSVNVSRVNLYNPKFIDSITALVKKYDINPSLLNLELTEGAYMDNPEMMIKTVKRLNDAGFVVLMDDFGSGYSSLNVLKDIAVDILKIDMKFLSDTEEEGRGENIIASVIRMAKWLNIPVIAEGAETSKQVDFLRSVGCEYVQGYYYAKPMPCTDYENVCENSNPLVKKSESELGIDMNKLFASNPQMEMLFGNVLQAVALYEVYNNKAEVLRVNNAFYEIFGYNDKILKVSNAFELADESSRAILVDTFERATKTKEAVTCEYRRIRSDGKKMWIHIKIKLVNVIGNKSIIIGSLSDVTSQHEIDRELNEYRSVLLNNKSSANRILIIDDCEMDKEILRVGFGNDFEIAEAANGQEALKIMSNSDFDIVLVDLSMPIMGGIEFIREKNKDEAISGIPVVVITGDDSPTEQINALALGVNDYIIKPFVPEIVVRRVKNIIEYSRRLGNVLNEYKSISKKVELDQMTGTKNRISGERLIEAVLEKSSGSHAMLMIDIDDFKRINDVHGHMVGDRVIKDVAKILKIFFRKNDIVVRMGGDEFAVFVENLPSRRTIMEKSKELCAKISSLDFEKLNISLSSSIGIAMTDSSIRTFNALYKRADIALYNAKLMGKNCCCMFGNDKMVASNDQMCPDKSLLSDIESFAVVMDYDTYEILYAEKNLQELLNVAPDEQILGKKCYEVFHSCDVPCKECIRKSLSYDSFYKWSAKYKNGKQFVSKNKLINWHGRKAHLNLSGDISAYIKNLVDETEC